MRNMDKVNTTEFSRYTSHVMVRYNVHVQDCSLRVTPLPHDRDTIPCVAFHAIKAKGSEERNARFFGRSGDELRKI